MLENYTPPFRVGKKQKRAILDSKGIEIGIFSTGNEDIAELFCKYLNLIVKIGKIWNEK